MSAASRRSLLRSWLNLSTAHRQLTAAEIADGCGYYGGRGRYDRCFDDLKAMERYGWVERYPSRPARWSPK